MKQTNSDWIDNTLLENNSDNNLTNSELKNDSNESNDTEQKPNIETINNIIDKVDKSEPTIDEKYLAEYIGPKAEEFTYKILSWPGLIFTSLYIFYRKMYLLGFITLIIQFALIIFVNPFIALLINVLIFLFFNSIYISHVKRKIESIKHSSRSKDSANIMNICYKQGGVNKKIVVLVFILQILILFFSILYLPVNNHLMKFKDTIKNYADSIDIKFTYFEK